MNKLLWISIASAAFITKESAGTKCESLKNVSVSVRTDQGVMYEKTVAGCIERAAFDGDVVLQANVKNQTVRRLGRDSVRNMKHLHSVQFYRCQMEAVEPGAFRNVPNLRSVQIVSNELSRLSQGVFQLIPNLEIVKLNRNKIDTIEDGAFHNVTTLKKVYLGHNLLTTWSRLWFADSVDLQLIDFQFNKVKVLPKRAFQGLPKLKEISFDYNELEVIDQEAFKAVKQLDYLGLKYNKLKLLDHRAFPNQVAVKTFAIDANYLNFLSSQLLEKIDVGEMTVEGNPWKCACYDAILSWLHRTNGTTKTSESCSGGDIPVCSFPATEPKTCTETVDEEVTTSYLEGLKKLHPPWYCARLD